MEDKDIKKIKPKKQPNKKGPADGEGCVPVR
jgi:hypothetical protein